MRTLAFVAIALSAGCGTFVVNRAATTPHAVPQMHSGHGLDSTAEVSIGASSLGHLTEPDVGNAAAAVEVPGTQLHGDGRVRLSDNFAVGFVLEDGLESTVARPKGNLQPPVENGDIIGYGITGDLSIGTSNPQLRVGLGFDLILWNVPYVEYQTCVDQCIPPGSFTQIEHGHDNTATVGVSVTPSYRMGDVTIYGGLTARQHPTIEQKGVEQDPLLDDEAEVESGPFNLVVSAGAEMAFADGAVKGSILLYQDTTSDPVQYGPGIAAMVTIPIGRRKAPPPPVAPPPPPPPYYGPPSQ